jgi:hypothetical protein
MLNHISRNLHNSNLRYNTTLGYILQTVFAYRGFYFASLGYVFIEESFRTLNAKLTMVYILNHHPLIHQNSMNLYA